jgi:DNA repair photolyase
MNIKGYSILFGEENFMIKEVDITNAFEKEVQPDGSTVDTIDSYVGCQIQCPYCFQMNDINWSKDIWVRKNIAYILKEQIKERSSGNLYIGSLSDPYMPLEEEYHLTRKCLQVLSSSDMHVFITTKSDNELILHDLDLLKSFKIPVTILLGLSNINQCHKGGDNVNIKVANELNKEGIDVWAFITPIMPYVMNIDEMIGALNANIPIYIDKLRVMTKGNQDKKIYNWIKNRYPQYTKVYEKILFEADESYYKKIIEKYHVYKRITFMFDLWEV